LSRGRIRSERIEKALRADAKKKKKKKKNQKKKKTYTWKKNSEERANNRKALPVTYVDPICTQGDMQRHIQRN